MGVKRLDTGQSDNGVSKKFRQLEEMRKEALPAYRSLQTELIARGRNVLRTPRSTE